jgi:hypothetical protein
MERRRIGLGERRVDACPHESGSGLSGAFVEVARDGFMALVRGRRPGIAPDVSNAGPRGERQHGGGRRRPSEQRTIVALSL